MKKISQQEYLKLSPDELKSKFPNLSQADIDFYTGPKLLQDVSENIGIRKYNSLIQKQSDFNNFNVINPNKPQRNLSEVELNQIETFENRNLQNKFEGLQDRKEYWENVYSNHEKSLQFVEGLIPDKKNIYKNFLTAYKFINRCDFILTEESIKNLEPIIKYFAFDKTFFDCENSIKTVGNKVLVPSFNKGLLIIGNVGNGKTSVMNAIQFMIDYYFKKAISDNWDTSGDWNRLRFKFRTTESLVTEYEFIKSGQEKEMFFSKYCKGNLFLDDLKREKDASNFGITNVVKSILEKRYNNQKNYSEEKVNVLKTFGTMNFHDDYPNNIDLAMQESGLRYGAHIYDRLFEMFNVIEFKGKSFRK
ncbi:hypothetical protein IUY40_02850 [Flavobacterium sp. ALJ2]|uniref:hypothetical protein n=1 Tax=Flavobacterium sp. ALJ2 TaxID=2786960 RepID=UPI00189E25D0|nr:hypothetical protein [Flavobacterium sp. ALJ2]MBF7090484.1 hypothetical protein [Flavobacterium sp. ALJ2]